MFKSITTGILAGIITLSVPMASADEKKAAGSGPNPFVDCGIGAALFPTTHWAAVISNVIWDVGTTAVTSATASPETCNGKDVETAQFIIDNYDNLAEETARGQGEHLTAMFSVMGCNANAQNEIITTVRSNMADVVTQASYADQNLVNKASDYYNVVNAAAASNCSA